VEGDGTGTLTASASQNLSGGANGVLTLTSQDFGSKQFADINVLDGSFNTFDSSGDAATRSAGTDVVARINGQNAYGDGLKASVSTALLSSSISFNESNNVAGADAKITITGGGSLFQIGQNVSTAGQIGIGIEAVNTARLGGISGKLYELGSGAGNSLLDVGKSVGGNTVTGAQLVDIISESLDRVNTLRGRLGAIQKNVIETNINSLSVALENISDARSQISDTDFAVETANLTKSQILSQAGISTLQIANSGPQQVLSLLRG
jgi:flagellin